MLVKARRYGFAALLAVTAAVLLVFGHTSKAALAGAGFAFLGAAVTRAVDIAREHRAEAAKARTSRQQDLDETRRIAYMALASRETDRYEVAATVVNALAHHGLAIDPYEAMRNVLTLVAGGPGDVGESERWLRGLIARITSELDPA